MPGMEAKRTAVQTLRRDLNSEMVAVLRVTRESLTIYAARIEKLERRVRVLFGALASLWIVAAVALALRHL